MQKTVGAGNKKEFVRMRSADKAGVAAAQPDQEIEADPKMADSVTSLIWIVAGRLAEVRAASSSSADQLAFN